MTRFWEVVCSIGHTLEETVQPVQRRCVAPGFRFYAPGRPVLGALQLAPDGQAGELLAADYAGMVKDGLLFEEPPAFAELVARCRIHSRPCE